MAEIRIEPAAPCDIGAFCGLLRASKLLTEDIDAAHLDGFLMARQATEIVGGVGVEPYGDVGLLRSLVVADSARDRGLGGRLMAAAEEHAAALGIRRLYLLTTTAGAYFEARAYQITARADAPAAIASTSQFSGLCPSSSIFMSKTL
ncbi:arsenic resistance N-acetyltransferase ArsN2 [Hydrocarboniphaga effusa]|uniref:arsenic resistance N-acetyltransferase ArsN2 n=1 Tax=Hydrocarboniphaga effusa TaxID=243629 RepID=UPI0035B0874F